VTRIFVGNLPVSTTDASLGALFAAHGKVESAAVIIDRETGRSRGFGYVEMPDPDSGRAIQALNGEDHEGRTLKVREDEDRAVQGGKRRGNSRRH
jgi:RNA recognition motif-containing protein